jgi:hypothetical protein
MATKRVLVEIDERVTDTEIRNLIAQVSAIADREGGLSANFVTKCALPLLPGQEIILGLRKGTNIDLIVHAKTNWTIPAGPLVGFFMVLPAKV